MGERHCASCGAEVEPNERHVNWSSDCLGPLRARIAKLQAELDVVNVLLDEEGAVPPGSLPERVGAVLYAFSEARQRLQLLRQSECEPKAEVRELLADYAHDAWSGWMRYLFSKCKWHAVMGVIIPANLVSRWERQIATPYRDLPEKEKNSDRKEADRMLAIVFSDRRCCGNCGHPKEVPLGDSGESGLHCPERDELVEEDEPACDNWKDEPH
jgi:hypothetical protein